MHDVSTILRELHDEYAERVNLAISEGRDDLVQALSDEFTTLSVMKLGPEGPSLLRVEVASG